MAITESNTIVRFETRYAKKTPNSRICFKCNIPFNEGEVIYRKRGGGRRRAKAYHLDCWEKTEH
jgi:hypothetical protein